MANATKLPPIAELVLYQWSRKGAPAPKLAAPIDSDDTTLTFSAALKDEDGTVVAGKAFPLGIRKSNGWTETCLATSGILLYDAQTANFTVGQTLTGGTSSAKALIVADTDSGTTGTLNLIIISGTFQDNETITDSATGSATANGTLTNSLSADGLTLSNAIRGIEPGNIDFYASNTSFADSHDADEPVFCNIPAFLPELFRSVLQGLIASGGSDFIIGVDAAGTVTISRSSGVGAKKGFLRWDTSTSKVQFSNDGTAWTAIDDTVSSVLFKISTTDTTAGYAKDKIIGSSSITVTQTGTGGNETLVITTSLPDIIDAHDIYTPAYLTGDTGAETNISLWDSVSDGSFRITIDGTAYNVDGIDFTAAHAGGAVTDMDGVAARIQTYIRALTSSTETCVWSTDHFIISSVNTTFSSAITVTETSTGTVGTDISGAGASDWMDCDTGNGVVTDAVVDETADEGKLVKLDANGLFHNTFLPTNVQEANTFFGATNATGAEMETLTDGSNAGTLHSHDLNSARLLMDTTLKEFYPATAFSKQATSGTATTAGRLWRVITQAANNAIAYISLTKLESTSGNLSFTSSVHDKNPEFNIRAKFNSAAAQEGFIGFVYSEIQGDSLEDSVMTLAHFGFIIEDATLYCSVADGTTQQKTSAITATVNNWNSFRATFDGTTATFYLNGTLVGTLNTNVPNGSLNSWCSVVIADASGYARTLDVAKQGGVQFDRVN